MLIRLSTPGGLAAPLDDVKQALRVMTGDDDQLLKRLIRQETTRYEDFTGRIMVPTELEWRAESWREPVCVPVAPIRTVTAIAYIDDAYAEQTLDLADWYQVETSSGIEVRFTDAFSSPSLSDRPYPVRVRFEAGYDEPGVSGSGDDPELAPVQQDQGVITAMVGWLYDRDEAMSDDLLRRMAGNRKIFR
jgi:uncharacterized phiE125 gp8 family phage protein